MACKQTAGGQVYRRTAQKGSYADVKHTCGRARDASPFDAAQLAGFKRKAAADDADDDDAAKVKAEVERLHAMADPPVDAELLKKQTPDLLKLWFTKADAQLIRKGDAAKVKARLKAGQLSEALKGPLAPTPALISTLPTLLLARSRAGNVAAAKTAARVAEEIVEEAVEDAEELGARAGAASKKARGETEATLRELGSRVQAAQESAAGVLQGHVALAKQAGAVALSATLVMRQLAPGVSTKPHQDTPTGTALVLDPMLIADCDGVQWNWGGGMALLLRERVEYPLLGSKEMVRRHEMWVHEVQPKIDAVMNDDNVKLAYAGECGEGVDFITGKRRDLFDSRCNDKDHEHRTMMIMLTKTPEAEEGDVIEHDAGVAWPSQLVRRNKQGKYVKYVPTTKQVCFLQFNSIIEELVIEYVERWWPTKVDPRQKSQKSGGTLYWHRRFGTYLMVTCYEDEA